MNQEQKVIKLSFATLTYEEPIVHVTFAAGMEIGFPETRLLISSAEELSGKKPYFILSDAKAGVAVTREGRKVAADATEAPYNKGCAVLLNSSMLTLGLNFFNGIFAPTYPYRVFTDKDEAVKWLLKLPL